MLAPGHDSSPQREDDTLVNSSFNQGGPNAEILSEERPLTDLLEDFLTRHAPLPPPFNSENSNDDNALVDGSWSNYYFPIFLMTFTFVLLGVSPWLGKQVGMFVGRRLLAWRFGPIKSSIFSTSK